MHIARAPVISITTDYGQSDGYVGAVKGVLLRICPQARLVDITHLVPPQDVFAGALILRQAAPFFPEGTIHLAVVDPGVGTSRRAVAVSCPSGVFVGPDNGLFSGVISSDGAGVLAVELNRPQYWLPGVSATFHGRDIFAPVAAHLAAGVPLQDVGDPIAAESLVRLPWPAPARRGPRLNGEVIHVDHFGNLITNVQARDFTDAAADRVYLGDRDLGPLSSTFGDAEPGEPVTYVGSTALLEIAVVNGSAAAVYGADRGTPVAVGLREA